MAQLAATTPAPRRLAFEVPRVLPDLANQRVHWSARNQQRQGWLRDVTWQARIALRNWPKAQKGERRRLVITQYRVRLLDKGNLWHSAKDVVDALKAKRWRVVGGKHVEEEGLALIYDDDPLHLDDEVRQVQVHSFAEERTTLEVFIGA